MALSQSRPDDAPYAVTKAVLRPALLPPAHPCAGYRQSSVPGAVVAPGKLLTAISKISGKGLPKAWGATLACSQAAADLARFNRKPFSRGAARSGLASNTGRGRVCSASSNCCCCACVHAVVVSTIKPSTRSKASGYSARLVASTPRSLMSAPAGAATPQWRAGSLFKWWISVKRLETISSGAKSKPSRWYLA